jgi:hypothetical protein
LEPKQKSKKKGDERGVLGGRKGEGKLPAPDVVVVVRLGIAGVK